MHIKFERKLFVFYYVVVIVKLLGDRTDAGLYEPL